jgi:nucleoid-associated protein YgaU
MVRPWSISKDCFWNISGRPWVYGDPTKWRVLYNANKAKLPQPDNPDLIHPNMILDIPSIKGEIRSGMWDASKNYSPLR